MRARRTERTLLFAFLIPEAAAYAVFLTLDLTGTGAYSTPVKYAALLGVLACALTRRSGRAQQLTAAALCFTALADLFLLVLGRGYLWGVASFCVVQCLYFLRLHPAGDRRTRPSLWLRLAVLAAALIALFSLSALQPLTALAAFYFTQLVCNALDGTFAPGMGLFALGLWLFVGCDVCVGLHNLSFYLASPPAAATAFAQVGMWLFYLPSQILLVLSAPGEKEGGIR